MKKESQLNMQKSANFDARTFNTFDKAKMMDLMVKLKNLKVVLD